MNPRKKFPRLPYLPLLVCIFLISALPDAVMADYVRIKGTVVNVRQGPGTSHQVLFQAEQGEEFDLIKTEGLWSHIRIRPDQEAWVFTKLVDIIEGNRPGTSEDTGAVEEAGEQKFLKWAGQPVFLVIVILLLSIMVWKRRALSHFARVKLKEISGYKREQAFRYDNRKPSDDSWEL